MTSTATERHVGQAFEYDVVELGYNYRLDEIHAALLLAQLDRLDTFLERREELVARYVELLEDLPVDIPDFGWPQRAAAGDRVAYHVFPVLLPETVDRVAVRTRMRTMGVQTSIHYPPAHRLTTFTTEQPAPSLPRTESLAARELTLPLFPTLTADQQELVRDSLEAALEEAARAG
jgi:dTDP-4-amino-4,6-dideoxygalactose transaminase